jgi:glycosyltransferase involved in cell wall biosynthesis
MTARLRVLVLIPGPLERQITGPSIRGWETAKAFAAAGHNVTAAAVVPEAHVREGIRVVAGSRRRLMAEVRRHDVIHGPVLPPYALAMLGVRRCVRVADLHNPGDLERGTAGGGVMRRAATRHVAIRRMNLRWADIVVSANQPQADRARQDLTRLARSDRGPELLAIPMGVPDPPPASSSQPIRELFPAIGPTDPVILWWGMVWRWLDAGTAIDAIAQLTARRPDVRLVFTAGRPANAATNPLNATEEARQLARERGLLDRNIFFLDQWVAYEDRHEYLADADIGLTLHDDPAEASMAARFRYMDYLWANLPCVIAAGDKGGDELAAAGAARLVPAHDPAATAAALEELLSDRQQLVAARRACAVLAERYRWSRVLAPLVARVEQIAPPGRSTTHTARITSEASRYYGRVMGDALIDRGTALLQR